MGEFSEGMSYAKNRGTRRRWTVRVNDAAGQERWLSVEVPPGTGVVHVSLTGAAHLVYDPQQLARVRAVYAEAMIIALTERGTW